MEYSRKGFKEWLELLPDEPFCKNGRCPISQFLGLMGGAGVASDKVLAYAIDDTIFSDVEGLYWEDLLPSQVLSVIESL